MPEKKPKTKFVIIAAVALVALTVTGGGIWLYQDAKVTEEAEGLATQLSEARARSEIQIGLNVDLLAEVRQANEGMTPAAEILEGKPELFDAEQTANYLDAFESVGAHALQPDPTMPAFEAPFDAADFEQSFIEHYRQASSDEREAIRQEHAAIVAQLQDLDTELIDEGATMHMAVRGAHDTVTSLLDSLPTTAESLTAELDEASEEAITAAHAAAVFESADPKSFSLVLEELTEHLIVYVETVVKAQENHAEAVEARETAEREEAERKAAEEAERKAAEEAAAAKSSNTDRTVQMCTRVSPGFGGAAMSLILVPC